MDREIREQRGCHLSNVTQLVSYRAEIQAQAVKLQSTVLSLWVQCFPMTLKLVIYLLPPGLCLSPSLCLLSFLVMSFETLLW